MNDLVTPMSPHIRLTPIEPAIVRRPCYAIRPFILRDGDEAVLTSREADRNQQGRRTIAFDGRRPNDISGRENSRDQVNIDTDAAWSGRACTVEYFPRQAVISISAAGQNLHRGIRDVHREPEQVSRLREPTRRPPQEPRKGDARSVGIILPSTVALAKWTAKRRIHR